MFRAAPLVVFFLFLRRLWTSPLSSPPLSLCCVSVVVVSSFGWLLLVRVVSVVFYGPPFSRPVCDLEVVIPPTDVGPVMYLFVFKSLALRLVRHGFTVHLRGCTA